MDRPQPKARRIAGGLSRFAARGTGGSPSYNPLMSPLLAAILLLVAAYLVGAIPFGYVVGRARSEPLHDRQREHRRDERGPRPRHALRVLVSCSTSSRASCPSRRSCPWRELARAPTQGSAARCASRGRGGARVPRAPLPDLPRLSRRQGRGDRAGTIFVLVPGPRRWRCYSGSRRCSRRGWCRWRRSRRVGSRRARLLGWRRSPKSAAGHPVSCHRTALVFLKHHSNVRRLVAGTESQTLPEGPRRRVDSRNSPSGAGLWFGGAAFFNFGTALPIFRVVREW